MYKRFVDWLIGAVRDTARLLTAMWEALGDVVLELFYHVAPVLAPAAPALFFGWNVYLGASEAITHPAVAIAAGLVAGLALESAGIQASKTALRFYGEWSQSGRKSGGGKLVAAVAVALAYLLVGISTILWLEGGSENFRKISIMMFVVTFLVYAARALMDEARMTRAAEAAEAERQAAEAKAAAEASAAATAEQARIAAEQRAFEREQRRIEAERAFELKREQQRLNAQVRIQAEQAKARASTMLAQPASNANHANAEQKHEQHNCQQCGRSFGSVQALNAHLRFCKPAQV